MLQEIFLSLSGVSSPILSQTNGDHAEFDIDAPQYTSIPERAMLRELAYLSLLHFEIKQATKVVQMDHPSPICKAVSSSIDSKLLDTFRKKIIEVESSILRKDAAFVGGYDIVPLSSIATEFAPWTRRLEWMRKTLNFMVKTEPGNSRCSGAKLLAALEEDTRTGFTDIAQMASDILLVGETAWMRSIASWLLYGVIPATGQQDFMIKRSPQTGSAANHVLDPDRTPHFVTPRCAENILSIGNALDHIRQQRDTRHIGVSSDVALKLLPEQLKLFKTIELPLNAPLLEAIISRMDISVSANALSQLLPIQKILEVSSMIQNYLLLGRGEFAIALITNVEERVQIRGKSQESSAPVRKAGKLDNLTLKDAELGPILAKTWSDLAVLQTELESEDQSFMLARKLLRLTALKDSERPDDDVLISTLAPSVALLRMDIPLDSSLNLFITNQELTKYTHINAHLLSIRRCQMKLADLWKLTSHRRCHPSPLAPPASSTEQGRRTMIARRDRERLRSLSIRRHWSLMSKVLFLINELAAYLQGDVIRNSWSHFYQWLTQDSTATMPLNAAPGNLTNLRSSEDELTKPQSSQLPKDPRTIAQAHRQFLNSLYSALFIDKLKFNKSLSSLLTLTDHFSALFKRLQSVWQGLDLQEDDGIVDAFMNYAQDEKDILAEMNRSGTELDKTLAELAQQIKDIEHDNNMNEVTVGVASVGLSTDVNGNFVPWRARTLDRLIMKLDFLQSDRGAESEHEDDK